MSAAQAEVWAYVDARGITHFAAEKLDDRYELFFRGPAPSNPGLQVLQVSPGAEPPASDAAPAAAGADSRHVDASPRESPAPAALALYGTSPYTARLAAYIEGTAGYQLARPLIEDAARLHRIDVDLLKALIAAESGFDPQAVSPKGAIGLMQVMPATAQRFGVRGDARTPLERRLAEPGTNIHTGTRYLRHLLNLFPQQLELALAAYNAGEGAVQRAGHRIPNIRETQNYVRTVMQLYALLKPPAPPPPPASALRAGAGGVADPAPAAAAPVVVRPTIPGAVPGRSSMPPSMGGLMPALPSLTLQTPQTP